MQVKFTPQAQRQLLEIVTYYGKYSANFVNQINNELYDHVDRLKKFPQSGRLINPDKNIRIFSLNSIGIYVVYRIYSKTEIKINAILRQEQMIGFE